MDIFLSWSTVRSRELANIFNNWVTKVIPQLEVYYSPKDIQPGERWSESIKNGLEGNPMGIFFVVEENIVQPWLNFEAGAISNQVGNVNVIPLLHEIEPSRITGPLTQFQAITYDKDDFRKLIHLINENLNDIRKIEQSRLNEIFEKWYPEFEESYNFFKEKNKNEDGANPLKEKDVKGVLNNEEQISEILTILRSMERSKSHVISEQIQASKGLSELSMDFKNKFTHFNLIFIDKDNTSVEIIKKMKGIEKLTQGKILVSGYKKTKDGLMFPVLANMNKANLAKTVLGFFDDSVEIKIL